MLYYANRINFEPEYRLPNFTLAQLYRVERPEEQLLNNQGQFFVHVSEKHPYVKELVRKAQDLNLTVSGDGTAPVGKVRGDIRNVEKGDQITFGTSSRFDVNWVKRDEYFCKKGYAPVYDIVKDREKIDKAMRRFAEEKRSIRTSDGTNIRFHTRFMVVDGRAVSYDRDQVYLLVPEKALREIGLQYDLITIGVVRG